MSQYEKVVAEIKAGPSGPQIAAIFDFDGTIINGFSVGPHLREQVRAGHIAPGELLELSRALVAFGLGQMDFSTMLALSAQFLAGIKAEEMETFSREVHEKFITKNVYPESRALIDAHKEMGHTVAIISSATQFQVEPAAVDLDIPYFYSSMLEVKKGALTGEVEKPRYGYGKVEAAEELFKELDIDRKKSFFYSDGDEDIPLLDLVGKPRPLNPNSKLRKHAKDNNWLIRDFNSRGRPSIMRASRTLGAYAALVTSFAAGLPILMLTGSRRKARNFSMSVFADTASALIGLEMNVKNEHHLWSHRPAVIIFNHQSKSDVTIMASLVRRDMVGIGKQEIKKIPIIGQVMQYAGTVFIDRKNKDSSIESMKPLIKMMHDEQVCVCIAPEGTRSVSKHLEPFKKGAFHIAMQAQVPIVPVVIHNAIDSAAKGQFFFNPCTVDVEILEPIDTSDWKVETIDQHIADTRQLYVEALSTSQQTAAQEKTSKSKKKPAKKSEAKRKPKSTTKAKPKASGSKTTRRKIARKKLTPSSVALQEITDR